MADMKNVVDEAQRIIDSKKYKYGQSRAPGYLDDDKMDCSEFIYHAYRNAGFIDFPALNSHGFTKDPLFTEVTEPAAGDIIYWSMGHVGIVKDPKEGTFLNAQSEKSGLRVENYKKGWWAVQAGRKFFRLKTKKE